MFYVYTLVCPMQKRIRYVGCSKNPKIRFKQHLNDKANRQKQAWIRKLKELGNEPKLMIYQAFDNKERALITETDLINTMPGLYNHSRSKVT